MKMTMRRWVGLTAVLFGTWFTVAFAGNLDAPAAPTAAGSAMFTLEDVYNRLSLGTAGTKRSGAFAEPAGAPGSTMHSLDDLMNKAPAIDGAGASPADVVTGKTYWGLTSGNWGPRAGTMPVIASATIIPGVATQSISAGYHDGNGKVSGDANLVSANIKAGTTIFGVSGLTNVVDTTSGDAGSAAILLGKKAWAKGVELTGTLAAATPMTVIPGAATQTIPPGYYVSVNQVSGDPGLIRDNIKAGASIFGVTGSGTVVDTSSGNATAGEILLNKKAWVGGQEITGTRTGGVVLKSGGTFSLAKRWYDNGDGTITDTTSGLIWLKNVDAVTASPVLFVASNSLDVIILVAGLQNGVAGLSDGSAPGDWRVPTLREMERLTSGTEAVLRDTPGFFIGIADRTYWTQTMGTTMSQMRVFSFSVNLFGDRSKNLSMNTCYVMPVRSNY